MTRLLIVGDPHIGKSTSVGKTGVGNALNSRIADQEKLLFWIIDQAVDNNVSDIILTGDVFEDPRPDFVLVNIFLDFIKNCKNNNIFVHVLAGNHDIKRYGAFYQSVLDCINTLQIDNASFYKEIQTIYLNNVGVTFLPFRDRRALNSPTSSEAIDFIKGQLDIENKSISSNYTRMLIGHVTLEGSLYVGDEVDNLNNELIFPLSIFNNYDYTICGHIHKFQVRSKNPYIAHIGSLDLSDFGETDQIKYLILFDTIDGNIVTEIPVPSRPLRRFNIEVPVGQNSTEYVIEYIKNFNENNSIKNSISKIDVKILDPNSDNLDRLLIEKTLYNLGVFHISSFSESKNISVVPLSRKENIDNTITKKGAIKLFSEKFDFDSPETKEKYISTANNIIEQFGN